MQHTNESGDSGLDRPTEGAQPNVPETQHQEPTAPPQPLGAGEVIVTAEETKKEDKHVAANQVKPKTQQSPAKTQVKTQQTQGKPKTGPAKTGSAKIGQTKTGVAKTAQAKTGQKQKAGQNKTTKTTQAPKRPSRPRVSKISRLRKKWKEFQSWLPYRGRVYTVIALLVMCILLMAISLATFRVVQGCGLFGCRYAAPVEHNRRVSFTRISSVNLLDKSQNYAFIRFISLGHFYSLEVVHDLGSQWSALLEWRNGPRCLLFDMRTYSVKSSYNSAANKSYTYYPTSLDEIVGVPSYGTPLTNSFTRRFVRHHYTREHVTSPIGQFDVSIAKRVGAEIADRCKHANVYAVLRVETRMENRESVAAPSRAIHRSMADTDAGYSSKRQPFYLDGKVVMYNNLRTGDFLVERDRSNNVGVESGQNKPLTSSTPLSESEQKHDGKISENVEEEKMTTSKTTPKTTSKSSVVSNEKSQNDNDNGSDENENEENEKARSTTMKDGDGEQNAANNEVNHDISPTKIVVENFIPSNSFSNNRISGLRGGFVKRETKSIPFQEMVTDSEENDKDDSRNSRRKARFAWTLPGSNNLFGSQVTADLAKIPHRMSETRRYFIKQGRIIRACLLPAP